MQAGSQSPRVGDAIVALSAGHGLKAHAQFGEKEFEVFRHDTLVVSPFDHHGSVRRRSETTG